MAHVSDTELLSLALGNSKLAKELYTNKGLSELGTLLTRASPNKRSLWAKKAQISKRQARKMLERLRASFELSERIRLARQRPLCILHSSDEVYAWANQMTRGHLFGLSLPFLEHEELWLLALGKKREIRATHRVCQGSFSAISCAVPDVLRMALKDPCAAFILVHNHPSGDPKPSAEDCEFTSAVERASYQIKLPMLDHVIVARKRYFSFIDEGISALT